MCGIFAAYSDSRDVDEGIIRGGLEALSHRGPDQKKYLISHDRKVGMVQTRLSLNDLSEIELPLVNENRSIMVIANAEIYNHKAIRNELSMHGHQFRTNCDTEVIPHLYEEYGVNFFNMLRGEFAFIIWDEKQKYLYAVRDRFGIKPLYYTIRGNCIYFSSEVPALLNLGNANNTWSREGVFGYTHLGLPYSRSLFSGIHEVPAGHFLSIRHGVRNIHQYWDINYHSDAGDNEKELIESIRIKLEESTSIRMNADVPVGCYLSGGIDSSALLGIAAKNDSQKVEAFTIEFDNEMVNESDISSRTAENLNVCLHTLRVDERAITENFIEAVKKTCFPMPNSAGVARYLLSRFARDNGFKAVLSGEGADEVFLGYWGAMLEASEDSKINTNFSLSSTEREALLRQLPLNRSPEFLPQALKNFKGYNGHIPGWFTTQGYFNAKHRSLFDESILEQYADHNCYKELFNDLNIQNRLNHFDNVQVSSYTWIKSFFPSTMLNWIGDRAEMAHGIESRQPYLDHELFELVSRIPTHLKIKNGRDKYLLREAVKPFVTEEIYNRKKFMFQAPPLRISEKSDFYNLIKSIILDGIHRVSIYDKHKVVSLIHYAEKSENMPIFEKAELSHTLTTLAGMVILSDHYRLS